MHEERRDFVCTEPGCGKAFKAKRHALEHQTSVRKRRRDFVCKARVCGKAFLRKSCEVAHQKKVHGRNLDWLCKTDCGEAFSLESALMEHKKTRCRLLVHPVGSLQQEREVDGTEDLPSHSSSSTLPFAESGLAVKPKVNGFEMSPKRYKKSLRRALY